MQIQIKSLNQNIIISLLVIAVFGQRFVIPFGEFQCPIILIGYVMAFLIFFITRQLRLQRHNLNYGSIFFACATLSLAINHFMGAKKLSANSFFLLILLYFPYFFLFSDNNLQDYIYKIFRRLMFIAAILSVVQIALQAVAGISYFDIFSVLPEAFVQHGFNTSYPIEYGSRIYKSNAFFFLEPSFTSQFIALALILEYLFYKRLLYYIVYVSGFICTFSGTGILLLVFFVLLQLRSLRNWKIIVGVALIGISIIFIFPTYLNLVISRINEFGSEGSSGFLRFVAPVLVLYRFLTSNSVLFGLGAGTVDKIDMPFIANFTPIPKVVIEYGIITGLAYLIFVYKVFIHKLGLLYLSSSLLFLYLFLAGNLLSPQIVLFCYIINVAFTGTENTVNMCPEYPTVAYLNHKEKACHE